MDYTDHLWTFLFSCGIVPSYYFSLAPIWLLANYYYSCPSSYDLFTVQLNLNVVSMSWNWNQIHSSTNSSHETMAYHRMADLSLECANHVGCQRCCPPSLRDFLFIVRPYSSSPYFWSMSALFSWNRSDHCSCLSAPS